jgi:hypothetical protein
MEALGYRAREAELTHRLALEEARQTAAGAYTRSLLSST